MSAPNMEVATPSQSKLQLQCNLQVFSAGQSMQRFGTLSMWKQRHRSAKQCKRDSAKRITKNSVCQNRDKNAKPCTSQNATLNTRKTVNINGRAQVTTRFGHQSLELARIM